MKPLHFAIGLFIALSFLSLLGVAAYKYTTLQDALYQIEQRESSHHYDDETLSQDLAAYSEMLLWKYPELKAKNNPYGITKDGEILTFSSTEEADSAAYELVRDCPVSPNNFASIKDYFDFTFSIVTEQ